MTLPIDITTSLWLANVPVWEWEPDPAACTAEPALSPAPAPEKGSNDPTAPPAGTGPATGAALAAAFPPAPAPDATPDASRPGYHLVFKGFKLAGSVYWVPADSPQSRPWLRDTGNDEDRRHRSTLVRPAPDAAAADPLRGHRDDAAPDAAPDAA